MMSWPDQEPGSVAQENCSTSADREAKLDAEHEFLSLTMRIWVVTLFVLALPVLAVATMSVDPTEQAGAFAKPSCQSEQAEMQTAGARMPRRSAADVADSARD